MSHPGLFFSGTSLLSLSSLVADGDDVEVASSAERLTETHDVLLLCSDVDDGYVNALTPLRRVMLVQRTVNSVVFMVDVFYVLICNLWICS